MIVKADGKNSYHWPLNTHTHTLAGFVSVRGKIAKHRESQDLNERRGKEPFTHRNHQAEK
jgi:hypothetical protein